MHHNEWAASKQKGVQLAVIIQQHGRKGTRILFAPFSSIFHQLTRLLNYKSKSLGMLTIQYSTILAPLSKKCLTKQCKQQLQLCFFSPPPSVTQPFIASDDVQYAAQGHTYGTT